MIGLSPLLAATLAIALYGAPGGQEPAAAAQEAAGTDAAMLPDGMAAGSGSYRLVQWRPDEPVSQQSWPEPATGTVPQPSWERGDTAEPPERTRPQIPPYSGSISVPPYRDPIDRQDARPAPRDPSGRTRSDPATADAAAGPLDRARVVIHRPRGRAAADARALLEELRARGVGEAEIRTVGVNVSRPDVRYFHARDRGIARAVDRLLGREGHRAELKDFTHYAPSPSRGTVEIWLPG